MDKFSLSHSKNLSLLCLCSAFSYNNSKKLKTHHLFFSSHDLVLVPKVTMIIMMIQLMRQKLPPLKESVQGNEDKPTHVHKHICDQLCVLRVNENKVTSTYVSLTCIFIYYFFPCVHRWSCLFSLGVVFRHDCVG